MVSLFQVRMVLNPSSVTVMGDRLWRSTARVQLQQAANRSCNLTLFIRADDANRHPALGTGNDLVAGLVASLIQPDAEKLQALAHTGSNRGSLFADAAAEHELIQSTQGCCSISQDCY